MSTIDDMLARQEDLGSVSALGAIPTAAIGLDTAVGYDDDDDDLPTLDDMLSQLTISGESTNEDGKYKCTKCGAGFLNKPKNAEGEVQCTKCKAQKTIKMKEALDTTLMDKFLESNVDAYQQMHVDPGAHGRSECPDCHGYGDGNSISGDHVNKCKRCGGSGMVNNKEPMGAHTKNRNYKETCELFDKFLAENQTKSDALAAKLRLEGQSPDGAKAIVTALAAEETLSTSVFDRYLEKTSPEDWEKQQRKKHDDLINQSKGHQVLQQYGHHWNDDDTDKLKKGTAQYMHADEEQQPSGDFDDDYERKAKEARDNMAAGAGPSMVDRIKSVAHAVLHPDDSRVIH